MLLAFYSRPLCKRKQPKKPCPTTNLVLVSKALILVMISTKIQVQISKISMKNSPC
ncbi:Uncharacterised protein [Vibrio cholerae]|nr:Uncharacterised protein [Vibrio cholerae]